MTETEWLGCTDPQPMLEFLKGKASDRKLRLFGTACCRRIWQLLDEQSRHKVVLAERFADGFADKDEMPTPWPLGGLGQEPLSEYWAKLKAIASARDAAKMAAALATDQVGLDHPACHAAYYSAGAVAWKIAGAAKSATHAASWASAWNQAEADEYEEQVRLLRDIFGNPLRPAALRPSWLTPDVVTLAGHIYYDRVFVRMQELADTLEGARCDNADILMHCRQPGPHVGGCWVLDLLLGKE